MAEGPGSADHLAPYAATARTTWHIYLAIVVGIAFVVAAFSPEVGCGAPTCPFWLRPAVFGLGALTAAGALLAILRGLVWGSRVDLERSDIVWWNGPPGAKERRIAISRIRRIRVEESDGVTLSLFDAEGRTIYMPTECVRSAADWAAAMGARFASIQVELPARTTAAEEKRPA
jgi:hypothetical protein